MSFTLKLFNTGMDSFNSQTKLALKNYQRYLWLHFCNPNYFYTSINIFSFIYVYSNDECRGMKRCISSYPKEIDRESLGCNNDITINTISDSR